MKVALVTAVTLKLLFEAKIAGQTYKQFDVCPKSSNPVPQSNTSASSLNKMLVGCYQLPVNKLVERSVWSSVPSGI